ncbi:MAG: NAD(P)-dependent oxidoreductase [Pseudomonadota bacterium]
MRVAVTGTSGRIGRAIHFALGHDQDVLGIDRSLSSATAVLGDIGDSELLLRTFEGCDAVVHTAALHAPHVGILEDAEFHRVNVEGTKNVIRAARANGISQLVFTSTTALYGHAVTADPEAAAWITEDTVPQPKSVYHETKLECEALLADAAGADLQITVLRMSRCFPEPAPLMAAYRLHRGIDARDVATGHRAALLNRVDKPYRLFILSGSTPFEQSDLLALKSDAAGVLRRRCPTLCRVFEDREWPLPAAIDRVYDASLAQRELGWRPNYGFDEVLRLLDSSICEVLPPQMAVRQVSE